MTGRPLNEIKERATSSQKVVAPPKSNSDDSVIQTPAPFLVLTSFAPGAQARLLNFIESEVPPASFPDAYGYGAGRAVRGDSSRSSFSSAKVNWRIPEPSQAKLTLLDNDGNLTAPSCECLRESEKDELKQRSIGKSKFSKEEVKKFEEDARDDVNRRMDAEVSIAQRYRDRDYICSLIKDAAPEVYVRLKSCGECFVVRRRRFCGRFEGWSLIQGCGQRICPFCGRARANAKFKSYWPKVWAYARRYPYLRPCSIVLTYRDDTEDWAELTQREKLQRTKDSLSKLLRRKEFKAHVSAGVWSIENTKNSHGNDHIHVHMVIFRKGFWPKENLESLWAEVTSGIGGFVWISAQDDLRSTLKESLKYSLKPASVKDWTTQDAVEFLGCKGMKLTTRFGGLSGNGKNGFKMTQEEQDSFDEHEGAEGEIEAVCPSCGRSDEWVLDTLCVGRFNVEKELRSRSGDWAILNIIRSREARAP